jgi:hypothetical protein
MYKRRMVTLGPASVELLPMEQWDTGIVGSADEKKAVKAEARQAASRGATRAAGALGGEKKKAPRRKKPVRAGAE